MARPKKTDTANEGTGSEPAGGAGEGNQTVKRGKRYPKSKTEAVKRAMRRLGPNAMPLEIADWVWKKYGMEMDKSHVSTVKSTILKRMREDEGDEPAAPSFPEPVYEEEVMTAGDTETLSIAELLAVKELVRRIGPERLRELADLLSS
jgi:hypothetical protein